MSKLRWAICLAVTLASATYGRADELLGIAKPAPKNFGLVTVNPQTGVQSTLATLPPLGPATGTLTYNPITNVASYYILAGRNRIAEIVNINLGTNQVSTVPTKSDLLNTNLTYTVSASSVSAGGTDELLGVAKPAPKNFNLVTVNPQTGVQSTLATLPPLGPASGTLTYNPITNLASYYIFTGRNRNAEIVNINLGTNQVSTVPTKSDLLNTNLTYAVSASSVSAGGTNELLGVAKPASKNFNLVTVNPQTGVQSTLATLPPLGPASGTLTYNPIANLASYYIFAGRNRNAEIVNINLGTNQVSTVPTKSDLLNTNLTYTVSASSVSTPPSVSTQPSISVQSTAEVAADGEFAAFQLMDEFLNLMLDPFVDGRLGNGVGGVSGRAMAFAPDEAASLPPDIALAYAGVLKAPPVVFEQRWTTWGASYGGGNWTNGNATTGSSNVSAQTYGIAAGMDYHYSPDTIFGFALGGGGTNWGIASGGTGRSDAFQSGVYGITRSGPAYLAGALAFANHWMTTNRAALGDALTATFDAQSYGARLEGGYRYAVLPTLGVTPYAALQAQDFHTPGFNESDLSGGGLGLSYASMNATDVRSELGARFDNPEVIAGMPLLLRARLAWAHDWVSNPSLGAAFETLPGTNFTVYGAPVPQNSALASAGAELFITPRLTLLAKFDGAFAPGSQTYTGTGTLRYTW